MPKMLFVLTSRRGFDFVEMATPYYLLQDADIPVILTSIAGGTPHPDPSSLDSNNSKNNRPDTRRFLNDIEAMYKLENTNPVESYDMRNFNGIYFVGGPGAAQDFPFFKPLQDIIIQAYTGEKIIGAAGYGAASLIGVKLKGEYIVKSRHIATIESRLQKYGALISNQDNGSPYCVEDWPFVTAQNFASARVLGETLRNRILTPSGRVSRQSLRERARR